MNQMNLDVPIHQLLFSTVRIEATTSKGIAVGTGFITLYESNGKQYLFLVANKHLVQDATIGKFFFTKSDGTNPLIGKRFDIEVSNFEQSCFGHPSSDIDVAVMPLLPMLNEIKKQGQEVYFRSIPLSLIPTREQQESLTALEEVIFVGYPNSIYDTRNLLPIIRKGTTATPISIDYEGKPLFLIDASVFPGSSGSPVMIYNQGSYATPKGITIGTRIHFLGLICQVLIREEQGTISFAPIPTLQGPIVRTAQMIDLGVVFKGRVVVETIEAFLRKSGGLP